MSHFKTVKKNFTIAEVQLSGKKTFNCNVFCCYIGGFIIIS